jgi:hypothetical protein
MRNRFVLAACAGAVSLALVVSHAGPSYADFHTQGVGVATAGSLQASSEFANAVQPQSWRLDFYGKGAAYFLPMVSADVTWDCKHDEILEAERPPDQRDGFTLTSAGPGETIAAGGGTVAGRCTGTSPDSPEPIAVICPLFKLDVTEGEQSVQVSTSYTRVGAVLQIAGVCLVTFGAGVGFGDFMLTALLTPTQSPTSYEIAALAFRFRG